MKKIEAIIRKTKIEEVLVVLVKLVQVTKLFVLQRMLLLVFICGAKLIFLHIIVVGILFGIIVLELE